MTSVSVMLPVKATETWQLEMTACAVATLRGTTAREFQLVVAARECHDALYNVLQERRLLHRVDVMVDCDERGQLSPNVDCNLGLDACDGDYVVYTGNDVFTRPGWAEALLECFATMPDCGVATLASADLPICRNAPTRWISEGVYGPFMMFPRGLRFDAERFPCQFGDTDLVMRVYLAGKRSYRNWVVKIEHLNRQTVDERKNDADNRAAQQRFAGLYARTSPIMARLLIEGWII